MAEYSFEPNSPIQSPKDKGQRRTKLPAAVFSFLYFLKIKISKIYVCFEIFQKYPRSPPIGRQALSVIFFLIRNEFPGKKRLCRPLGGRQGPVAQPTGDRRWAQPTGAAGGLSPPPGDRGYPYKRSSPPLPSSFEPENSTKNPEKKRGVRRRKAAKPCRIQHL